MPPPTNRCSCPCRWSGRNKLKKNQGEELVQRSKVVWSIIVGRTGASLGLGHVASHMECREQRRRAAAGKMIESSYALGSR